MSRRTDAPARSPRRAALASWIGSALEYYDFAVYGTAAAIVLNRIFFPEDTAAIGILKSMVVVGVAYVVRPFGAMIVGPLGDRYGRRFVLMLTLFLMGFATFAIGCLPTYSEAGILAPTLLVICRMIQGLSAAGEQASSISISWSTPTSISAPSRPAGPCKAPSSARYWQPPCSFPSPPCRTSTCSVGAGAYPSGSPPSLW